MLVESGANVHAQVKSGKTPLYFAEHLGHEALVSFLRTKAQNMRRSKSTTASVINSARSAAEVAAFAMAALLIAEEEDQKQALPPRQGNSDKARKPRNRRKANPDKLDTGSKGHDEALRSSVASSSGRRDSAGERDDMTRDAALHTDGEINAYGGGDNNGRSHNEPEGSIGRNVQPVEAGSIECEASTSHGEVEQTTITQAGHREQK